MKAVMYGAGNIGRGFIGKVFSESGYDVCFIDVFKPVVQKLNADRKYPVKIVSNNEMKEVTVENVYAVDGLDIQSIAKEIAHADVMATAVGVNVLKNIVKPICSGLMKRIQTNNKPLNIIICENLMDADLYFRLLIENEMGAEYKPWLDKNLGLVEASIGRMVPVMTEDMKEGNLLKVWVEPYEELPMDKEAFVGSIPRLKNTILFSPFDYYIKKKLFIHNMGHTMCAYLGYEKAYTHIYQSINDNEIRDLVMMAMQESARALYKEYGIELSEIYEYIDDLLNRFGNKVLGDTIERVGKDPVRKLGRNDRLVGAALYCESQGVKADNIIKGIVSGLNFTNKSDEKALEIQSMINEQGSVYCLHQVCGIDETHKIFHEILRVYNKNVERDF